MAKAQFMCKEDLRCRQVLRHWWARRWFTGTRLSLAVWKEQRRLNREKNKHRERQEKVEA